MAKHSDLDTALAEIRDFLPCPTPESWVEAAVADENEAVLLIDHAQCEKKAASTAMSLMYRYVDKFDLLRKMSKLAREELVHFDQVIVIMKDKGIEYQHLSASRYAGGLHEHVRKQDPEKLIDKLIIGAYVEARSCERFEKLVPVLEAKDPDLAKFYYSLLKSEARHYQDYLRLAQQYSEEDIAERVEHFGEVERQLIESPDTEFRFHSGMPA